ncbi:four-helix bundle copper-binding protein [Rufibacter latericius]|uniref:Four-helix bundle copper-binding protein n=1 Tax=Rufibacter latericius TaxID=2487040 RepID=A0A3M9ML00_9BACT|nr:four-helix bundle copper-binding protein [Rufibacter latericius]RNI26149.1 four-helix bundle copper-binding protein [Rufibacter latericius]
MHNSQIRPVLDALNDCILACEHCASSCLHEEHLHMMVPCIEADRDCADVCRLTHTLLARGSKHGKHLLRECIEVCEACAAECSKHDHDHCQECAATCRRCAEACRSLAA